ncbi:MAG: AAA family ATPase [candidate division Zixibacteria bacterium]|nr:AAA family ATPase [Candidatus Tariuqbacter arcticus]
MINRLQLIRNIGPFDSENGGANIPLDRLTLIYAENGRGKTMLSSIFRSLATGDPLLISERHRLGAQYPPHVVIDCDGGPAAAMFQNGTWNRTEADIAVYDDLFVDQNVFSGLAVAPAHRQNLHVLVLGAQGVALNRRLQQLVGQIDTHIDALRAKAIAIPATERGIMSVDDFCALKAHPEIDIEILAAERMLLAAREQDKIRNAPAFESLALPHFNVDEIDRVLQQDLPTLDQVAVARVQAHLAGLGQGGESWVAEGMERVPTTENCPFCAQKLDASPVFSHYRAYFSAAYTHLKQTLTETKAMISRKHSGDVQVAFEHAVRVIGERLQFWSRFCDVFEMALDTEVITSDWRMARESVEAALNAKQAAPLERLTLPKAALDTIDRFNHHQQPIAALNQQILQTNVAIQTVKDAPAGGELNTLADVLTRLKAIKARHTLPTSALCEDYLDEKTAKANTGRRRDEARNALEAYQQNVFPDYQTAVTDYLVLFNAGFRLGEVRAAAIGSGSGTTCNYNILINNTPVTVAGGTLRPGQPSFGNTLSAGDRNALALAFFFASLDQDTTLADKIIVIDDPVSSLDEHRSLTTVQEIRRLAGRTAQVIVLSHNKPFLCNIWEGADKNNRVALEVRRANAGLTLASWDVNRDSITEHDKRHTMLKRYLSTQDPDIQRHVAEAIRPHLEAFLRVAQPEYFKPETLLGNFLNCCDQVLANGSQILNADDTKELRDLKEFANKFHHDTNPAWETETINDTELLGFVKRTLEFAKR